MLFDMIQYTEPLGQTPSILRATIEGRPEAWLDSRHAPDCLSPREAVAHLVLCERGSWVLRGKMILEQGQFISFRSADSTTEEDLLKTHSVQDLLAEFESLRAQRLRDLQDLDLSAADLARSGIHPRFGTVTVGQLLATWVAHDLYHLGQIFKSYSALYVDQIGPWQEFLNLPHFN